MTSQEDAFASLRESRMLSLLEWAAPVAFAMTGEDYDEDRGHDQAIVGLHNFVYIRDLLDRATSNGRFALAADVRGAGADVVRRGITPHALAAMPVFLPGAVARSDYQQSPGWAADNYRVLLQSYKFGDIDRIKWGARSEAKRLVAAQAYRGGPTLFEDADFGLESLPGIPDDNNYSGTTLVAAHAYDPISGNFELYIGQSKNPEYRGDSCWHWRAQLLSGGHERPAAPGDVAPTLPGDPVSTGVDEITVQLRKPRRGDSAGAENG